MSWHCEDAAINYTDLPAVTRDWHAIVADLRRRTDVFDDWGMFAYTSADTGVDYLTEIDVGIWEQRLDDARVGAVGAGQARHRRASRCDTAGRSAPATAPAGRARSTWCPRSWAGASR